MVLPKTRLTVGDNSGPSLVECIRILSGAKYGTIGDKIVLTVKKTKNNQKIKKGQVLKGIIIRTKFPIRRLNNDRISFTDNSVILLNTQENLLGNRITGNIPKELRKWNNIKILSLAKRVI